MSETNPFARAVLAGFVGVRQIATLAAIVERPGLSVRDHAAKLNLNKPSINRACSALLDDGLIARGLSGRDKRLCILNPTIKGRRLIASVLQEPVNVAQSNVESAAG